MAPCVLCKSDKTDDIRYGEILRQGKVSVHTFCLYLTSNLVQAGEDDEGFLGFLLPDIRNEERRISRLICCYCNKAYANIGCCEKSCRRTFHMICGMEHGALNQFANTFQSFCDRHTRKTTKKYMARPSDDELCSICYESIWEEADDDGSGALKKTGPSRKLFNTIEMLRAPCCQNGWFHKYCLQRFAKNAGYFFKCPLCNDKEKFCETLPYQGVFIPSCDAAWEVVPHAYEELLERPKSCSAANCHNRRGREHSTDSDPLVICTLCGSVAMHESCLGSGSSFQCDECVHMLKTDSGHESLHLRNIDDDDDDENSEIDVCNTDAESDSDSEVIRSPLKSAARKCLRISSSDEEDSDVDPCEDFNYCMRKKLANSMVSSNASEKSAPAKHFEAAHGSPRLDWGQAEDEDVIMRPSTKISRARRISDSEASSSNGYETATADQLDELRECMQREKSATETKLEISCIARRTRRRSSTAHATPSHNTPGREHLKSRPATMFSDESSNSSDASSHYFTAIPTNTATPRNNALETSCIANRTRRRSINKEKRDTDTVSASDESSSSSSSSTGSSQAWHRRRSDSSSAAEDSGANSNDFTDSYNGSSEEASLSPPPKADPMNVSTVATRIKRRKLQGKLGEIAEEEEYSGGQTPVRGLSSLGKRISADRCDTPTVKAYRPGPRSSKQKLQRNNRMDRKSFDGIEERENDTPLRNFSRSYNFLVSRH